MKYEYINTHGTFIDAAIGPVFPHEACGVGWELVSEHVNHCEELSTPLRWTWRRALPVEYEYCVTNADYSKHTRDDVLRPDGEGWRLVFCNVLAEAHGSIRPVWTWEREKQHEV
jgi:hypothetical protein